MLKSVIISGANGFIGKHLISELISRKISTIALVRDAKSLEESEFLTVIEYDIDNLLDLNNKLPQSEYSAFINLAWGGVAGAQRADYSLQLKNVEQSLKFIEIAANCGCKKYIAASSVSEYECILAMQDCTINLGGKFIYSTAKMTSHYMGKTISHSLGIEFINANIANTYGEGGSADLILHSTILKLLSGQETIFSAGDQDYDFLYVKDVANGLIALAEDGKANKSYYIGSDYPRKLKEYLLEIRDIICPEIELGLGKLKDNSCKLPIEYFNNSDIKNDTGFVVKYPFSEGIKNVIEWYGEESDANRI